VGSATRDGKRLIAVVLGASSGTMRAVRAAQLLDRGFANNNLSWLRPSLGTVNQLVPVDASPPNLRDEMCGGKHKHPATDADEEAVAGNAAATGETGVTFFAAGLQPPMAKPSELMAAAPAASEPITVYTGPTRTGAALIAAVAADADQQTVRPKGKKGRHAGKKPDADAADASKDAKSDAAKPDAGAKPAGVKHANAKPDAASKSADKSAAPADQAAAKPAKPKTAAKPAAAKPAPKSTSGDTKPAG
jgi:D-alanyl-D-alanine carboxypeptidase